MEMLWADVYTGCKVRAIESHARTPRAEARARGGAALALCYGRLRGATSYGATGGCMLRPTLNGTIC